MKGDSNTSNIHKIVNGRKRKNTVISLEKEGEIIEGDENLLKHATKYYAELFGPRVNHDIHIDQGLWDELDHVSEEEPSSNCHLSKKYFKSSVMVFSGWPLKYLIVELNETSEL